MASATGLEQFYRLAARRTDTVIGPLWVPGTFYLVRLFFLRPQVASSHACAEQYSKGALCRNLFVLSAAALWFSLLPTLVRSTSMLSAHWVCQSSSSFPLPDLSLETFKSESLAICRTHLICSCLLDIAVFCYL